jgi:hypothetical protein
MPSMCTPATSTRPKPARVPNARRIVPITFSSSSPLLVRVADGLGPIPSSASECRATRLRRAWRPPGRCAPGKHNRGGSRVAPLVGHADSRHGNLLKDVWRRDRALRVAGRSLLELRRSKSLTESP